MGEGRIDPHAADRWTKHTDDPGSVMPPCLENAADLAPPPRRPSLAHDGPWLSPDGYPEPPAGRQAAPAPLRTGAPLTGPSGAPALGRVYTSHPAEQPARRTALDPVRDVYPLLGELMPSLSKEGRILLTAQFAHETAAGRSCFNFNPGNIKADRARGEPHMYLPGNVEVVSDRELARLTADKAPFAGSVRVISSDTDVRGVARHRVVVDPPHPASAFRAYASAREGIAAWAERFARYTAKSPELLEAMNGGDANAFASILKTRFAYYTDDATRYARGVAGRASTIRSALR
jgi:hypothetical protein